MSKVDEKSIVDLSKFKISLDAEYKIVNFDDNYNKVIALRKYIEKANITPAKLKEIQTTRTVINKFVKTLKNERLDREKVVLEPFLVGKEQSMLIEKELERASKYLTTKINEIKHPYRENISTFTIKVGDSQKELLIAFLTEQNIGYTVK